MALVISFIILQALLILLAKLLIIIRKVKASASHVDNTKKIPLPPGPTPWPIVGNLPELLINKPTFRWIHTYMNQMNLEIACFRFGNVHVIPVTCPEIAREFLRKHDALFASRPRTMATRTLSQGYLTAALSPYGEQWMKMKKILSSELLSPRGHRWLHNMRVEEADNLVKYVYNQCKNSGQVNVRVAARHYCGNVIRKLIFGKRYFGKEMLDGRPGIEEEEHVDAAFNALKYIYAFCISDYFPFLEGLDLDGHESIVRETQRIFSKYHDPLIDERIQQWKDINMDTEKKMPQDWLDIMITLKGKNGEFILSHEEVKAQIDEMMLLIVDNPSNATEWTLAEMLNQPEIIQKAQEELDRVVGKERLVQEQDIPQLNYIKACIRESFRIHPVVPFNVPHVALENTTIRGYKIPKGSHILLSRTGLGRNPKMWDQPLKFNPERHLNDQCSEILFTEPELGFISFSTGRRGCIGSVLGTNMTVMLLARLLQGFHWGISSQLFEVNLTESAEELFLAEPLVGNVKLRLPQHLYDMTC